MQEQTSLEKSGWVRGEIRHLTFSHSNYSFLCLLGAADMIPGNSAVFPRAIQEAMSKQQVATGPEGAERLWERDNKATGGSRTAHLHKQRP